MIMAKHQYVDKSFVTIFIKKVTNLTAKHHLIVELDLNLFFLEFESSTSTWEVEDVNSIKELFADFLVPTFR